MCSSSVVLAEKGLANVVFPLPHVSIFDGKAVHTGDYRTLGQEWHRPAERRNRFHNP